MELKLGTPKALITIFFTGRKLNDFSSLADYKIEMGTTLLLASSLHCNHCRGGVGACACSRCPRPSMAHCVKAQHCVHCLGKRGVCACTNSCARRFEACCWKAHCTHCKGGPGPCCCDKCSRPATSLCETTSDGGVPQEQAGVQAPLLASSHSARRSYP